MGNQFEILVSAFHVHYVPDYTFRKCVVKALKLLGFIKKISREFKLFVPLKSLYCSLIRPVLEYESVL